MKDLVESGKRDQTFASGSIPFIRINAVSVVVSWADLEKVLATRPNNVRTLGVAGRLASRLQA